MVTDVSGDELSTPVFSSRFSRSPSVVSTIVSPPQMWEMDFERELSDDMRALLADMNPEGDTNQQAVNTVRAPSAGAGETSSQMSANNMQPENSGTGAGDATNAATTTSSQPVIVSITPIAGTSSGLPVVTTPKRRSCSLANRKERNRRGSWSTDPDEMQQIAMVAQNCQRPYNWSFNELGQQIPVPSEFLFDVPVPRLIVKNRSGYSTWAEKATEWERDLTPEEIELLFFNRIRHGMPVRTMLMLTIATADDWNRLLKPYRRVSPAITNPKHSNWTSGYCRQEYQERNVIDPAYCGPNLEKEGRTIAIACGDEAERYSTHVFCAGCTVEDGAHWCAMDGLCQMCVESDPKTVRARYKRLNDAHKEKCAGKAITRRDHTRTQLTQHMINVEQVDLLKEKFPNWEKPEGLEVPEYDYDDFKPKPMMEHRIAVAVAPLPREHHEAGHRLMRQSDNRYSVTWTRRQMEQMADKFCKEEEILLTSGSSEQAKITAWLRKRFSEKRKQGQATESPSMKSSTRIKRTAGDDSSDDDSEWGKTHDDSRSSMGSTAAQRVTRSQTGK